MEAIIDGARIFYLPVGAEEDYPLIVLHGGPGLDHTEMHPWLDPLADTFRLIYLDQRGQGRSERVDPATLSLLRFAEDVSKLAAALGLRQYALMGHSYGSFVTLAHAVERGDASYYIISGGTASFTKTAPEIQANLASFEPAALREQVTQSWALEPTVRTQEEFHRVMEMQMPFHFMSSESQAYRDYMAASGQTVYAPEVLAYFSEHNYPIEYEDQLGGIRKPTLVMTGAYDRTCTPRAARELAAGIPGAELLIVPNAGHMTHIEQPQIVLPAIRDFFKRHPVV
jgi:proline-specific peptidase